MFTFEARDTPHNTCHSYCISFGQFQVPLLVYLKEIKLIKRYPSGTMCQ